EIDEVAEVMPQDVVDPAALVAGGADIDETLDEEAPGDVTDLLLARAGAREQGGALATEAHGMAEAVDLAAALARRDDALRGLEAHRDRDLDQRVLARTQRLDRLLDMHLAGRGDDHDVHRRVGQRFVERRRRLLVAEALRELGSRLRPP